MLGALRVETTRSASTIIVGIESKGKVPRGLGVIAKNPQFLRAMEQVADDPSAVVELIVRDRRAILVGTAGVDPYELAGRLGRRIEELGLDQVRLVLGRIDYETFATGLGVLAWEFDTFRGRATQPKPARTLTLEVPAGVIREAMVRGLEMARCVNLARDLSQTPPNVATPLWMADQARRLAQEVGLTFRVIQGDELETERLIGLMTVGRASANPPCLIRLEYRPEGSNGEPLVLLGKTITYDTGGLSLKPREGMVGMKRDKDGGCAVLGAMRAVATLVRPRRPVVGILVAAENHVNGTAYRPDDVITYRNGVSVEVTNTDAEGRLVLADGLCWAADVEKPRTIVDVATLTGGVVVALGKVFAGYFCEDEQLRHALEGASWETSERLWRLPLHAEYRRMLKSPIADIVNSNPRREAHPIMGGTFLSYFVPDGLPWAHIDIAGVHTTDKDQGPHIPGPTGFGVRLLASLVARLD